MALADKTVVVGVSGGIAAYKAAELVRLLRKQEAEVHVMMTRAAREFIAPLTLQTLSGHPVMTDLFDLTQESEIGHIRLADDADLVIVAPATADVIARMAAGMADDPVTTVALATRARVLLAPAMNVNMWEHPLTRRNVDALGATGRFFTIGPGAGELACGWVGTGRMVEPPEIVLAAQRALATQDLAGRRVLVSAGPTWEPLDPVRYLGNRSSGKMGYALARAAALRGAQVTLVSGPVALVAPPGVERIAVERADEMRAALLERFKAHDVVVMAAAVADYRPATPSDRKLGKRKTPTGEVSLRIELTQNPDILAEMGAERRDGKPLLVGFAAETVRGDAELLAAARAKLAAKKCDLLVANNVAEKGAGFSVDTNRVVLVAAGGGEPTTIGPAQKDQVADAIWDRLREMMPHAG
ncbi:MAG TPA: bifunctional phosphopantothenoylcysteine decarboxylase/phosphopantothenate--cysteine ligase CoaBC [Polyangia bacterium]|nr:bifunctional phosphopantothenoylcysteine decarboxylase/phosphopantothenate--cysteine ligase CoaBC [Polyangia bacterium]